MDKPTIFFSHSSNDKDIILPIKNRMDDITGGTMNVFMSSDGQSIPFGRNWVHKIEEGLSNAQIMFIFVTPNSIASEWIYFEAGYAYSKGIEVIPVGIGMNVGQLKAPLNLLQGFDVLSVDSMNNFVTIINRKFNVNFKENFTDADYETICKISLKDKNNFDFASVFDSALYYSFSQYHSSDNKNQIIRYNIDKFFSDIMSYLNDNNIPYSNSSRAILVNGIKIWLEGEEKEPEGNNANQNHKISIKLSTYHFEEAFNMLLDLFRMFDDEKHITIAMTFNEEYDCIKKEEQLSSLIAFSKVVKPNPTIIGFFSYKDKIDWWIRDAYKYESRKEQLFQLYFSFKQDEAIFTDVADFMKFLLGEGIIYRKSYN